MAHKAKRVILFVMASVCSLAGSPRDAFADEEMPSCPDLSAHQKVLDQGIKRSESGRTSDHFGGGGHSFPSEMIPWDLSRLRYAEPKPSPPIGRSAVPVFYQVEGKGKADFLPEKDIETLPLKTEADMDTAEDCAMTCEELKRYDSAKKLYERILAVRENGADKNALASTLEDLARVYVERGASGNEVAPVVAPESYRWASRRWMAQIFSNSLLLVALNSKHSAENTTAGKDASREAQDWEVAAKLYSRVLEVQHDGYVDAGSLINMALLKEWQGQDDVWALYVKAMSPQAKRNPGKGGVLTAAASGGYGSGERYAYEHHHYLPEVLEARACVAAVDYCNRNNRLDLLRTIEQQLFSHELWSALSNAILAYLHHNHTDDGFRLFRQVLAQSTDSYPRIWHGAQAISSETIVALIPHMSANDMPILRNYVVRSVSFDALPALMQVLQEHGMNDAAVALYHDMLTRKNSSLDANANKTKVVCLVQTADFYLKQKSLNDYFSTIDQAMSVIEDSNDIKLAEKKALLDDIDQALSKESKQQLPIAQQVATRAQSLSERYRKRIEKHECIEMADRLDNTGSRLENQTQYSEAEKMYRESLAIRLKNLDPEDPDIAFAMDNMARICVDQKRYGEAQKFFEQELLRYKKNPRQQDRDYAAMLERYGDMLVHAKQTAKADQIYEEARAFYRR
jgi:tetratricopeptide (TPR) repeat protein